MPENRRSSIRATAGVGIAFAVNGAIFAAVLPWYPLLSARLGLSAVEFGFIVAAFAVGAIASAALPAPLIGRLGPVRVAVLGTAAAALSVASAAWATSGWMLAAALFFAGFFDAIVDVAQNVAGIRVQESVRRSVLSSMHALWSLGGVVSAALSTVAAALGIDMRLYLAGVGVACVVLVAVGGRLIGDTARGERIARSAETEAVTRGRMLRIIAVAALPLTVIAICGTMIEDVANNWAAISAVEIGGLPEDIAGVAFTVVIGSQCVGRFTGDVLIHRFGRVAVARTGGAVIAAGGVLVVAAADRPWVLFIGLALIGYGSATLVPSALSAAAALPGVSEGAGVTFVSWLMRCGFLATSPLVGSIADVVGLRWGLAILMVIGLAVLLLSGALDRRRASDSRAGESADGGSDG